MAQSFVEGFGSNRGPAGPGEAAVSVAGDPCHRHRRDARRGQRSAGYFQLRMAAETGSAGAIWHWACAAPRDATYHYVFQSPDCDALAKALGRFACGASISAISKIMMPPCSARGRLTWRKLTGYHVRGHNLAG